MQKYYDYHTHSAFSCDSDISIEQTCYLAEQRGAAGLTFTDHVILEQDPAYDIWPDVPGYIEQLAAARQAFPQLQLGRGLEVDLCPARRTDIDEFLSRDGGWDFVLGSVHELSGYQLTAYDGAFEAGQDNKQAFCAYFKGLYECVKAVDNFDALGHVDLIRRDRRWTTCPFAYDDYAEILDPLLKLLIERGQGLEVNTAGWRYGLAEAHPGLTLLRRYRQMGGEIITCGSDCHSPSAVFYRIQEGYQLIKEAGFKYVSLFEGRQLKQLKLEI